MTSPLPNRAEFLRLAAAGWAGWLLGPRVAHAWQGGQQDQMEARIAAVIGDYDRQGIHRTATDVDDQSADWLADQATRSGGTSSIETFTVNRVDVAEAYVEIDGRRVDGLPMFDGAFTNADGISGRLGEPDAGTPIAVVVSPANAGQRLTDLRRSSRQRAIIVVTNGTPDGLCPINADSFTDPFGPPVLMVSSGERSAIEAAMKAAATARLVARVDRVSDTARNVVALVPGRQLDLEPVVVMTPRSGWWHCASERGGGIACWLQIMRATRASVPARPFIFVASSGHELGYFGFDRFVERRPAGTISSAAAWVHLGANIGAAGGAMRLQASDTEIQAMAGVACQRANAEIRQRVPLGTVPAGEARTIHLGGGRYVSFLGSNALFHNPADRWPDAVDVPKVARFARALIALTAALGR
jgi:hypothetical protein